MIFVFIHVTCSNIINYTPITKQTYKAIELRVVAAFANCWYRRPAYRAFFIAPSDAFFDASLTKSVAAVWIDGSFFAEILTYGAFKFFINDIMKRLLNGFNE